MAVYGTLRGQNYTLETPTESTYNIDNVFLQDYVAPQVTVDQNKVSFFDSGDIGAGNHSLSVTITSATGNFPYYLDFLTVVPPPPVTTSPTPPTPPQTTSTLPTFQPPTQSSTSPPAQIETSVSPGTPNSVPPFSKPPTLQPASAESSTSTLPPQPGDSTTTIAENGTSVVVQIAPSSTVSSSISYLTPP